MNVNVNAPLLRVSGLIKTYGAMAAVDDVSFEVQAGQVLGIGGPNGAGKTTLFDVVTGVSRATAGKVEFLGDDVTDLSAEERCHRGMARTFQLNAVFDTMSVRENLLASAYFGSKKRIFPALRYDAASHARADEAMEIAGLGDFANRAASGLPVLQRKLLMLASAIASQPRLLLLDEPVGGLNIQEIEQCAAVFRRLRDFHGMTIIVVEHVMSFMAALADTVMILHHGAKLFHGSVVEMAANAEVVEVYLGTSAAKTLAQNQPAGH